MAIGQIPLPQMPVTAVPPVGCLFVSTFSLGFIIPPYFAPFSSCGSHLFVKTSAVSFPLVRNPAFQANGLVLVWFVLPKWPQTPSKKAAAGQ
jgi:hypothetical protein